MYLEYSFLPRNLELAVNLQLVSEISDQIEAENFADEHTPIDWIQASLNVIKSIGYAQRIIRLKPDEQIPHDIQRDFLDNIGQLVKLHYKYVFTGGDEVYNMNQAESKLRLRGGDEKYFFDTFRYPNLIEYFHIIRDIELSTTFRNKLIDRFLLEYSKLLLGFQGLKKVENFDDRSEVLFVYEPLEGRVYEVFYNVEQFAGSNPVHRHFVRIFSRLYAKYQRIQSNRSLGFVIKNLPTQKDAEQEIAFYNYGVKIPGLIVPQIYGIKEHNDKAIVIEESMWGDPAYGTLDFGKRLIDMLFELHHQDVDQFEVKQQEYDVLFTNKFIDRLGFQNKEILDNLFSQAMLPFIKKGVKGLIHGDIHYSQLEEYWDDTIIIYDWFDHCIGYLEHDIYAILHDQRFGFSLERKNDLKQYFIQQQATKRGVLASEVETTFTYIELARHLMTFAMFDDYYNASGNESYRNCAIEFYEKSADLIERLSTENNMLLSFWDAINQSLMQKSELSYLSLESYQMSSLELALF